MAQKPEKILVITIGFILAVVLAIGINEFIKYQRTRETRKVDLKFSYSGDWPQYQSDYGWQVAYPPDWQVLDLPAGDKVALISPQALSANQDQCLGNQKLCSPLIIINSYDSFESFKKSLIGESPAISGNNLEEFSRNLKTAKTTKIYTLAYEFDLANKPAYFLTESEIDQSKTPDNTLVLTESNGFYYKITLRTISAITQLSEDEKKILGSWTFTTPQKSKIEEPELTVKNWQDYENQNVGFSLKIPDDWQVSEDKNVVRFFDPNLLKILAWKKYEFSDSQEMTFSVQKFENMTVLVKAHSFNYEGDTEHFKNYTLEDFLTEFKGSNSNIKDYQKYQIDENDFHALKMTGFDDGLGFLIAKNNYYYEMVFGGKMAVEDLTDIEKQILESFRFN